MTHEQQLQRVLARFFRRQRIDLIHWARNGGLGRMPDMQRWTPLMVEAVFPIMMNLYQQGAQQAARRIADGIKLRHAERYARIRRSQNSCHSDNVANSGERARMAVLGKRGAGNEATSHGGFSDFAARLDREANRVLAGGANGESGHRRKAIGFWRVTKDVGDEAKFEFDFSIFRPESIDFIRHAAYEFCASTNATATTDLETAIAKFRTELAHGIAHEETNARTGERRIVGDSVLSLNARVGQIFNSPDRAARIAQTETMRAVQAGAWIAAKESGVVSKRRWLASSDACPKCLALNGKEVGLDEPFYVDPKGGPYAVVYHSPLHPRCMCDVVPIVAEEFGVF